mgnify:CR=1 FL=1
MQMQFARINGEKTTKSKRFFCCVHLACCGGPEARMIIVLVEAEGYRKPGYNPFMSNLTPFFPIY